MTIQDNISLKKYNTFGIEVMAEHFVAADSLEHLKEAVEHADTSKRRLTILGGGSNILLTRDVRGIVLKNEIPGIFVIDEDDDHVYIKVGAGVNWHVFVLYCLENNFAGVENLALIPGNVGASPMQNIGAYGVELKDVFHSLEALQIRDTAVVTFNREACKFGYRDSIFKNQQKGEFIITSVTFILSKTPKFQTTYGAIQQELDAMKKELSIQTIAEAVIRIRQSKLPDPNEIGNAGSFFKNPTITTEHYHDLKKMHPGLTGYSSSKGFKIAAGWMIEQCGWKGYRIGDAGCHAKQALVLVNYGNASGKEILSLSEDIIEDVKQKFNIQLETEVNII